MVKSGTNRLASGLNPPDSTEKDLQFLEISKIFSFNSFLFWNKSPFRFSPILIYSQDIKKAHLTFLSIFNIVVLYTEKKIKFLGINEQFDIIMLVFYNTVKIIKLLHSNGMTSMQRARRAVAAPQQPGCNNSPRGTDQPATGSSNSSSRRQPAAAATRCSCRQYTPATTSHHPSCPRSCRDAGNDRAGTTATTR